MDMAMKGKVCVSSTKRAGEGVSPVSMNTNAATWSDQT